MLTEEERQEKLNNLYDKWDQDNLTKEERDQVSKEIAALEGTEKDSETAEKPKVVKDRGDYQWYDDQLKSWKDLILSVADLWKGLDSAKSRWPTREQKIRDHWKNPDITYEQYAQSHIKTELDRCYKKLADIYEFLSHYNLNDYKQQMILKLVPISEIAKNDLIRLKLYDELRFLQAIKQAPKLPQLNVPGLPPQLLPQFKQCLIEKGFNYLLCNPNKEGE
jgi:hypothetical protein